MNIQLHLAKTLCSTCLVEVEAPCTIKRKARDFLEKRARDGNGMVEVTFKDPNTCPVLAQCEFGAH